MRIFWLPRAVQDRQAQLDYIAQRNPHAALKQGEHLEGQIQLLLQHPLMGRPGRVPGTRELVISKTPFVLVYRYHEARQRLEMLRLLHGSQQWPP